MKRFLLFIPVLLLSIFLFGCSNDNTAQNPTGTDGSVVIDNENKNNSGENMIDKGKNYAEDLVKDTKDMIEDATNDAEKDIKDDKNKIDENNNHQKTK